MTTTDSGAGRLQGKIAIITGAARGQGAAEAAHFVRAGARVVLTDVLDDEGESVAAELGDLAEYRRLDVADEGGWSDVVDHVEAVHGSVDVLVNNAGIYRVGSVEELPVESFDLMYRINQRGVFLGMRAVVAPMRRAGKGSIINTASGAALRGVPGLVGYSATKFAVRGMTKVAAAELGAHSIRVNAIHPGLIDTPMLEENSEEAMVAMREMVPMGRLGTADDVAQLAVFLASDASSYISGGDFQIDGAMVT